MRLGLGTLRLPMKAVGDDCIIDNEEWKAMIDLAEQSSIRFIDCAPTYCMGLCEKGIGEAGKGKRNKFEISTKIPLEALLEQGDLFRNMECSRMNLNVQYIDYYLLWNVKYKMLKEKLNDFPIIDELNEAKRLGKIRHIGFSTHDTPENALRIIKLLRKRQCNIENIVIQYNLLHREMEPYMPVFKKYGLEIYVMGAAAGGNLEVALAYEFVWRNPNVDMILTGAGSRDMLKENIELEKNRTKSRAFDKKIEHEFQRKHNLASLYCTSCNYCQPCPAKIDISGHMKVLQQLLLQKNNHSAGNGFHSAIGKELGRNCLDCGKCEQACPQKLPIRDLLSSLGNSINS